MRSQTRVIAAAIIVVIFVLTFARLNADTIPDYLPQEAHDYFHPQEQSGDQQPNASSIVGPPINEGPHLQDADPTKPSEPSSTEQSSAAEGVAETKSDLDYTLEKFLQLPVLSYEESVAASSKTCPLEGVNYDRNAVKGNGDKWPNIPSSQILEWRQEIAAHLRLKQEDMRDEKSPSKTAGRGIVMAAGDRAAIIRARTSIRLLKSYNLTLPIEIFHFSDELSSTDEKLLKDLSQLEQEGISVTVRLVEGVAKGNGWKQFQIKGAAIQQSSFDEILYLDTDSYLLRNPDYLFEGIQWNDTGLLLWPDFSKSHPSNPIWRLLGQDCRNEFEGESGQIFISRTRHQDLMWLVEFFAQRHEDFYGFMGGDRDSFRAAALLLGKKWSGPGRLIGAGGGGKQTDPPGEGHTMLQADPEGKWLFVHANLIKHANFQKPLWSRIQRTTKDTYAPGSTYGSIESSNDKVGDGVKVFVSSTPRMTTTFSALPGHDDSAFVIEDWDSYDELKGFEQKWFALGGVH